VSTNEKPECADGNHAWTSERCGTLCTKCGLFYAVGQAPWDPDESDENEDDEEDEFDCSMDSDGYCDAAGSEECELECPYRRRL
jgi:hypothetical protein